MPKYESELDCFNKIVSFNVPDTVVRSTTADIVRRGNTTNDEQAELFSQLRNSKGCVDARLAWQNARMAVELSTPDSDITRLIQDLQKTSFTYTNVLFEIAKNGVWNCGEFADFALMTVEQATSSVLKKGYMAKDVTLNNPKIPEQKQKDRNHDHAFVLITDRQQIPIFVIDLWQSLVTGKPFFDSVGEYVKMLKDKPDGHYVRSDVVEAHIKQVSEISTSRATGDADKFGHHKNLHFAYGATPTAIEMANRADVESLLQGRRAPPPHK